MRPVPNHHQRQARPHEAARTVASPPIKPLQTRRRDIGVTSTDRLGGELAAERQIVRRTPMARAVGAELYFGVTICW
jgi:hypothetical protein